MAPQDEVNWLQLTMTTRVVSSIVTIKLHFIYIMNRENATVIGKII